MNLKRKLEIATKALGQFKKNEDNYLDYRIDKDGNKIDLHPNRVATNALKEMEGLKDLKIEEAVKKLKEV